MDNVPYLIAITIHFGGKFEEDRRYVGGEIDVLEEWDWYSWSFSELFESYVELGCSGDRKFAFKVKNTDELVFFKDDKEFRTRIYNCVDVENEKLDVYIENVEVEDEDVNETYQREEMVEIGDTSFYEKSDDSLDEDDEAEMVEEMDKQLQYDKKCDPKKLNLQLGMQFKDVEECKAMVKLWAIVNGHNIKWVKSEAKKLQARCETGCPWKLYASTLTREPTCVIKTYVGKHDCVRPFHNRQATSGWIAKQLFEDIKSNPLMRAQEMQRLVKKKYNSQAELSPCYRAKDKALKMLRGTLEEHYAKIRSYLSELQK